MILEWNIIIGSKFRKVSVCTPIHILFTASWNLWIRRKTWIIIKKFLHAHDQSPWCTHLCKECTQSKPGIIRVKMVKNPGVYTRVYTFIQPCVPGEHGREKMFYQKRLTFTPEMEHPGVHSGKSESRVKYINAGLKCRKMPGYTPVCTLFCNLG